MTLKIVFKICKYSEYESNTHTQTSLPFLAAKAMALAWKRSTKIEINEHDR